MGSKYSMLIRSKVRKQTRSHIPRNVVARDGLPEVISEDEEDLGTNISCVKTFSTLVGSGEGEVKKHEDAPVIYSLRLESDESVDYDLQNAKQLSPTATEVSTPSSVKLKESSPVVNGDPANSVDISSNENLHRMLRSTSSEKLESTVIPGYTDCCSNTETRHEEKNSVVQEHVSQCDSNALPSDVLEALSLIIVKSHKQDEYVNKVLQFTKACTVSELTVLVQMMIDNDFLSLFTSFLQQVAVRSPLELVEDAQKRTEIWPTVKKFLMIVWIVCDKNAEFCKYVLQSQFLHHTLLELEAISHMDFSKLDWLVFYLKSILGILHNISRHVQDSKWTLRGAGLVNRLRLFLTNHIPMVRVKSLIILSYIISETENEIINSDDENIIFMLEVLKNALQSAKHMSAKYGMRASEVLKGLNNLAINDENKLRIVRNGALPLYEDILTSGEPEEQKLTITSLWSLAFHHYSKRKMKEMPGLMTKLYELLRSEDEAVCHAARGTYWELENVTKAAIGQRSSGSSSISIDNCHLQLNVDLSRVQEDPNLPHIMISYQWDCQPIMIKVKDRLRNAGYKVWMDVEHMSGSTLEAMALAVEKAAVILVCMSEKYKNSPNCRTEAEYVYRLRKDFIPLRLQREYVPDGWLGILVGTRLYFDIHSKDEIDKQMPLIIKELRDRGKISPSFDEMDRVVPVTMRVLSREAAPVVSSGHGDVISWDKRDVSDWLTSVGIPDLREKLCDIDGSLILEMKKIQKTAPEYFFSMLRLDFSLTAVEVLKFSGSLRSLRS